MAKVVPVVHHANTTGAAANPAVLVDGPKWDAGHTVTGLSNLDDTADADKPVSTAQATADALVASNAATALAAEAVLARNANNLTSGTVPAARMPALTGDITTSAGAVATTLATVNANVGTFGSATQASQVTVNAKGQTTAAANVTVTPAVGSITGLGTGVGTALAINVGTAGSPVVNGGVLGTPSSGVATNLTGLPLTTGVTGTLPVANGGTGDTGTAWSQTTPTVTPVGGAFTTVSGTVRQKVEGKKVHIWATVVVTSVGTATSGFSMTIPTTALNTSPVAGIDNNIGTGFLAYVSSATINFSIAPANHTYFANGTYEAV